MIDVSVLSLIEDPQQPGGRICVQDERGEQGIEPGPGRAVLQLELGCARRQNYWLARMQTETTAISRTFIVEEITAQYTE